MTYFLIAGLLRSQQPYAPARPYPLDSSFGRQPIVESGRGSQTPGIFRTTSRTVLPQHLSQSNAGPQQQCQSVPNREGERSQQPGTPRRQNDEVRQRGAPCGTSWSPSVPNGRTRSPTPTTARQEDEVLTSFSVLCMLTCYCTNSSKI